MVLSDFSHIPGEPGYRKTPDRCLETLYVRLVLFNLMDKVQLRVPAASGVAQLTSIAASIPHHT
jgi:hypothetical protein